MRRTQPTPTPTGDTISYDKMKNVDDVGAATLELGLYLRAPKKNNRGWASQYLLGTRYILLTRDGSPDLNAHACSYFQDPGFKSV
ncbi:hypothetical protein A7C99_3218 [Trichophyton rubrum]|uniref:Uncharacterized protein n=1 Tax=Trichophyton rubrum TaxID=5551 RepID=A0A178F382_TRIRU|nr:hypothetical protein A7C99_3218 [Trichophyton rubrum]